MHSRLISRASVCAQLFYCLPVSILCQNLGFDPREATVSSVHQALFSRSTTCREVTLSFLARIQALNDHVNAIIALNPYALDTADNLDSLLSRGNVTGSLFCIPTLIKDNYDTFDMNTTAGCLALAGSAPSHDAPTVRALREAGAVILGKVNLHELGLEGLSVSSLGGQTINPYDFTRTAGGSSGGSGAAIAASFAVFAVGTDTANSLRSPASANSLFSCRPTRGLITRNGVIPISYTQDTVGPIARCTEDLAVALSVMASTGVDAEDEATALRPLEYSRLDYVSSLRRGSLKGLRLGVLEGFFNRTDSDETTPVNEAFDETVATLQHAGAVVVRINDSLYDISAMEKSLDTQRYEYRENLNRYLQRSSLKGTFPQTFDQLYSSGNFLVIPFQYEFVNTASVSSTSNSTYDKVQRRIERLKLSLQTTFSQHRLDALIYPEQKCLAVKIGEPSQSQGNGILAAVTGSPVVTVPIGFSPASADAPIGVPIGMEILGRPWTEQKLLQIAYQFERRTHVRRTPVSASRAIEVGNLAWVPSIVPDRSSIDNAFPVGVL